MSSPLSIPGSRHRGFTLLEALVALTLSGLITAAIGLALRTGLDAADRARRRGESHDEARGALEILSHDLSAAFLSGANAERTVFHGEAAETAREGDPFLTLTTLSYRRYLDPEADPGKRSDAVRVEYSLESGPLESGPSESGVKGADSPRQLVRKERWLTEIGAGESAVVCERVAGLTVNYLSDRGPQPTWDAAPGRDQPAWAYYGEEPKSRPAARHLPRAVEIDLRLAPTPNDEGGKPRDYHTVVAVAADTEVPFETEVVLRPQQSAGAAAAATGASGNLGVPAAPGGAPQ